MYGQVETGYDYPGPGRGRVHPGKLARRLIFALVFGALAGLAIMLQVKGWSTLASEAGGSCGSGDNGTSYGACPRGITPALVTSFLIGLWAVPAAIVLLFGKGWLGWLSRVAVVIGAAGGLLAGQSLFAMWHGSDLPVGWTAPFDSSDQLTTVGAWTAGGSLVRVRVDEIVSYDAVTGRQQWTLPVPGTDVACSVSGLGVGSGADSGVGVIGYGQDSTTCDHLMAVDLATGRQLWAEPVADPYPGAADATGAIAIAGGTAITLTADGIAGYDLATGTHKWTQNRQGDCNVQQLAGSGSTAITLGNCAGAGSGLGHQVARIDPATGKPLWQHQVNESSDNYSWQILSASPVVISEDNPGPRGQSMVRVFGADGAQTADFPVGGSLVAGTPESLNLQPTDGFGPADIVTGGLLVGVTQPNGNQTALTGWRLSDGQRLWVTVTPDQVHDIVATASGVALVDESDPAYSLETIDLATGKLTSLGFFDQGDLEQGESGLYVAGGSYLIVNQHGDNSNQPPIAAIKVPPAKKG
jgi:outer membrane protein assembly factor BamB